MELSKCCNRLICEVKKDGKKIKVCMGCFNEEKKEIKLDNILSMFDIKDNK